ncbi:MAG TPA: PDDEXK nuclease domain-containing protein [Hanamia sp.]|nr:PDDEXK nuclease domain-containing protein [Hanamia sp.]
MKLNEMANSSFVSDIKQILDQARQKAYSAINVAMVEAYWFVGKKIVEQEQQGQQRAGYGQSLIKELSKVLTLDFGKGFSETNIRSFRLFYLTFPEYLSIQQTLSAKLSWSHFQLIMRVSNLNARAYYLKEAADNGWSVRTLDRNISTLYYDRLLLSQKEEPVKDEMIEKTKKLQQDKFEFIKNPSVLEFLNLPANTGYTESELESALINNLQNFILELGKGFAFVEQQQLIRTETRDYFIDMVFYNYLLKCFVLIDLKTSRISHEDVGQMDMYVRMYDELKKSADDNPTLGIVLCTETDQDIARYSILKGNEQIFATKYKLFLPTEEELRTEIERGKLVLKLQFDK